MPPCAPASSPVHDVTVVGMMIATTDTVRSVALPVQALHRPHVP